ncbi:MAG: enoyl-CoA hydratase/isomerase family protein [Bdellovibrionales bacterium]|nr:enoyl-CoA hydratase/isomerase family protein [Bdellovibrionales bacterium]
MKVIFKEHAKPDGSFLAEIKLHRPAALNALDLEMILQIKNKLNQWKKTPNLSAVFLHGEGDKAFCAGGDIKDIYSAILLARKNNKDPGEAVQTFFENEYRLNYLMHTYPFPIITWGHGFIMGGGLGLFLASSHKIMTEDSSLSMPEINIGFFPDVGVSHTLSRLPEGIGLYLALTGCRINYQEAQNLGMANFYFKNTEKEKVLQNLISSFFTNKEEMTLILKKLQKTNTYRTNIKMAPLQKPSVPLGTSVPKRRPESSNQADILAENWIEKQKDNITSLLKSNKLNLESLSPFLREPTSINSKKIRPTDTQVRPETLHCFSIKNIHKKFYDSLIEKDKKWEKNRKAFLQGSPTSAGIICEQLKRARNKTLKEVFQTDLVLALNFARGSEFSEGVRALLLEKNSTPVWKPNSVELLTEEKIQQYFCYDPGWINPLQEL